MSTIKSLASFYTAGYGEEKKKVDSEGIPKITAEGK